MEDFFELDLFNLLVFEAEEKEKWEERGEWKGRKKS